MTRHLQRSFISSAKSRFILLLRIYFHIDVFIRLSPPGIPRGLNYSLYKDIGVAAPNN